MRCKRWAGPTMALAAIVGLASIPQAKAELITYSTSGVFNFTDPAPHSGNGTNSVSFGAFGTETLSFTGTTQVNHTIDDPSAPMGTFTLAGGTLLDPGTIKNATFTLTVTETAPPSGSQNVSSTISGSLKSDSGNHLMIAFDTTTFTLGDDTYTLPSSITIKDPSIFNSYYSQADLTASIRDGGSPQAVPEPSTFFALSTGVVPLALWTLRRLRAGRPSPSR